MIMQTLAIKRTFLDLMGNIGIRLGRVLERVQSARERQKLAACILQAQDHERRAIARELHDSVGQFLACVQMRLNSLEKYTDSIPQEAISQLEDAKDLVRNCIKETRTIAYLLHPPMLEQFGLASAAREYVAGFSERSGIDIEFEVQNDLERLSDESKLALFRVLQESLTNVHRHAGSSTAKVNLGADSRSAWIEVEDKGRGMKMDRAEDIKEGVGISGMRARLKSFGGNLQIQSGSSGTVVRAVIPRAPQEINETTCERMPSVTGIGTEPRLQNATLSYHEHTSGALRNSA